MYQSLRGHRIVYRTALGAALLLTLIMVCAESTPRNSIVVATIDGPIGPATRDYILQGLGEAASINAELFVLKMNTPGGLDSAMRDITQAIISSPIPVVVFVSPGGARAASAGTYILFSAHIAAMAPATTLGAATPIDVGVLPKLFDTPPPEETEPSTSDRAQEDFDKDTATTMNQKMVNDAAAYIRGLAQLRGRNVEWAESAVREAVSLSVEEAAKINVVEIVADDIADLLQQLNHYPVVVLGQEKSLNTSNSPVVIHSPDWRNKLLSIITDPNILPILMTLGIFGLIYEMLNPGLFLPGVLGGICLLLALYASQILPINYAGLALLILGIIFIISEAFVPSFGVLGFGGVIAFVIGSIILIDTDYAGYGISIPFISTFAIVNALFFIGVLTIVIKATKRPIESGINEMIGSTGTVVEAVKQMLRVRVHGEYWQAKSTDPIQQGDSVRITGVDGLTLIVEPTQPIEEQTS